MQARAFNIDLEAFTAHEIITGVVDWHPMNIIEQFRKYSLSDINTEPRSRVLRLFDGAVLSASMSAFFAVSGVQFQSVSIPLLKAWFTIRHWLTYLLSGFSDIEC